ncbi:glycoside hydrolase family 15 protein [Pontibacter liquoris]|uniref:glycoside hydrolase family 15 protein n=1 Tax=Pontibacter liquoris TaxID=2905677 RepID=UPI001FA7748E|nr:glycoside hydrolase family 15 protein [Pontibacter liquoris]
MAAKLSDHALIGNARAAALVSREGAIDWCCLPEFDSPAIFAALLDNEKGGHFAITPSAAHSATQRYLPDTNVAEILFETTKGTARLVDAFTAMPEADKLHALFPDHEILRVVEGLSGTVPFNMEFAPRIFYGRELPQLNDQKKLGIHVTWKENIYVFLSSLAPEQLRINRQEARVTAAFSVGPGEQVFFSFSYSDQSPAILPELRTTAGKRLEQTINYWKNWISHCRYSGLYADHVRRSALALKLLTHAPSGAIVAAPTTSLPEKLGGERNWDYRYCWLRDASFTIRVLVKLGFEEEAHAYMNWILHATQLTRPKLQVVYSVFGHASLKERTLGWLQGYSNARPVRIGNKADGQFQLDVYGEVLDALFAYASLVKVFDHDTRKFALGLGETICKLWDEPDNGIWEVRSALVQHTHSKVMAWVGLDRLIKLAEKYCWKEAPLDKFRQVAAAIRTEVERLGYNNLLGSYTRELSGSTLDASLLTFSLVGYCDAASPRMIATARQVYTCLSKNNLIYRYKNTDDGLQGSEESFGICSFWLAENFARAGELQKAVQIFETMLAHAGPTGLLSEEVDPDTHELLGNYPQGFTHIGLVHAALSINEAYHKQALEV